MANMLDAIPRAWHYGIAIMDSIHVPADRRSIEAPGHGYPAHNEYFVKYEAFADVELLKDRIHELQAQGSEFRAFAVNPLEVGVGVYVSLNGKNL